MKRYVQAILSDREYNEFLKMAKNLGLSVKDAAREAISAWVQQRGKVFIKGVGEQVFSHPAFEEWHRFFVTKYRPPARKLLLFHNCTWGKPYHEAWIFREMEKVVLRVLDPEDVHFVVVSSAGVIPREYWDHWPFCSYDADPWQFTPRDHNAFVGINSQRVADYLKQCWKNYGCIVVYFPLEDCARESVGAGVEASGCSLPLYFSPDVYPDESRRDQDYYACLTYPESLEHLRKTLVEAKRSIG